MKNSYLKSKKNNNAKSINLPYSIITRVCNENIPIGIFSLQTLVIIEYGRLLLALFPTSNE
jgi:hypothetical protein